MHPCGRQTLHEREPQVKSKGEDISPDFKART